MKHIDELSSYCRPFSSRLQLGLVVQGVFLGMCAGGLITLYRLTLDFMEDFVLNLSKLMHTHLYILGMWLVVCVLLGLCLYELIAHIPNIKGAGIDCACAEIKGALSMKSTKTLLAKFLAGSMCAFGGLSLGREGPSVQLGALMGKVIAEHTPHTHLRTRLFMTCGAAAGMAAAFHAPLTGTLFALEEIHKQFQPALLIAAMISSITADFVVSSVFGVAPVLSFHFIRDLNHRYYLFIVILGIVCGLIGAVHNKGMFFIQEHVYTHLDAVHPALKFICAFLIGAGVIYAAPWLVCGGGQIFSYLKDTHGLSLSFIAFLLIGKYLATASAFGSGAPGGTLFPLCAMGACTGALFGVFAAQFLGLPHVYVVNFIVLGIAGLFASVVRAPVTAVVLAFELTGSFSALLAVSIVAILSYVCANLTKVEPFYEHLTDRLLERIAYEKSVHVDEISSHRKKGSVLKGLLHEASLSDEAPLVSLRSFVVGIKSAIDGKLIQEVDWPDNVRVLMIVRAGKNILPSGHTRIQSLDELVMTFLSDTEADDNQKLNDLVRASFTKK